jgi:hypothetical protein
MNRDAAHGIAEAARWRLLGLLLERPRPGWHEEVAALGAEVRDGELSTLAGAARDASEGAYLALVGPGAAISPREVAYRGLEDPGWVLADIAHFYETFAYRPCAEDPLDHVAVEAGFVGYLFLKEELARAADEVEAAETVAAARQRFLETHLATVAAPLARALAVAEGSCLARAAATLAARVPPCPVACPVTAVEEVAEEGCGTCAGLRET